jgi:hypothetical protein
MESGDWQGTLLSPKLARWQKAAPFTTLREAAPWPLPDCGSGSNKQQRRRAQDAGEQRGTLLLVWRRRSLLSAAR